MHAVRIKEIVTPEGITIPINKVQRFQGKRVDIIILPDIEVEAPPRVRTPSLKNAIAEVFAQYQDVAPYQQIDPRQWEREIRNEW
ncbi:hypothetical protein U27_03102 [Candidatus Vecturithrix granuli]|uniref:Uncharacterized protein n=1 Tax=Vecturithrix granuli TaxID=1499967 RepID=A0A081BUY5_VECG1|nr:hypothetical protein U27_03102 [Candidatus Vecturithrix granuli]